MLTIFNLLIVAFTVYLIWFLEQWKKRYPPQTLAIKYSTIVVEIQMFLSSLSLFLPVARWINAAIAISISIWSFWFFPKLFKGLEDEQFKLEQLKNHEQLIAELKRQVFKIRIKKLKGCPLGLTCQKMGARNEYICDNYDVCNQHSY